MPVSKNRQFAKIANDVNTSGTLTAAAISSDVTLGGATIYASRSNLPTSGNTAGDQAFTTDTNRLYIWNGSGWYNVALLNVAPSIQSVLDSDGGTTPFNLSTTGAVTTITLTAVDSDGDPITYSATSDSDFSGLATLSQADNVFTITPFSEDSATTTSGTITFTATDDVNVASSGVQTFTLNFLSQYWDEVSLSVGTSSTNSLTNSTFIDRSTNTYTVTPSGSPLQTAFHPYLDYYSAYLDGSSYYSVPMNADWQFNTGDYTAEIWVKPDDTTTGAIFGVWSDTNAGNQMWLIQQTAAGYRHWLDPADTVINQSASSAVVPGKWTHLAITRSGDIFRLFVDGTKVSEATSTNYNMNESGGYLAIGRTENSAYFKGYVADAHVIKGYAKYTSDFTAPTEPVTAHANTKFLAFRKNRIYDESSTGYTITRVGSPKTVADNPWGQSSEYSPGANKGSAFFNAAGSLDVGGATDIGTGDFTFQAWIYPRAVAGTKQIFSNRGDGGSLYIGTNGTEFYPYIGGSYQTSGANLKAYEWSHVALTRTSGTLETYVNGVRFRSDTQAGDIFGSTGYLVAGGDVGQWDGYIADLQMTTGAQYTGTTYTIPTAPVGNTNADVYLPMDNAGIYDKTGKHTLTLSNGTATSTAQTKFADTSILLDGVDDYAYVNNSETLGGDFTIEMWAYVLSTGTSAPNMRLFTCNTGGNTANNLQIAIGWQTLNNEITGAPFVFSDSFVVEAGSGTAINDSAWHHIAVTRSGTSIKLFIDGTQSGSTATNSTAFSISSSNIGTRDRSGGHDHYHGYIEGLQILNGVAKYTTNFTVPTRTQGRTYQTES